MTSEARLDITDPEIYQSGIPHETFARLRQQSPVAKLEYDGKPYWAVTRYRDLLTVTRDAFTYSSAKDFVNLWDLTDEAKEVRRSIIETDPPAHVRLRRLGMPAFTGHRVRSYEDATRAITVEILQRALEQRDIDVVQAISAPIPIRVIVDILGVPADDTDFMVQLSDELVDGVDLPPGAYGNITPLELLPFNSPASHALFEYAKDLGDQRRSHPRGDLVSTLVHSRVEGDQLTENEFANMFQVLVFAGNETTRTAISNGIQQFMLNPDQLELLYRNPDLVENAVEEIIRYATPVIHMRRTTTRDTELAGVPIAAGDKVVIWYASANFDETVFENPLKFDISRPVRPKQLAFGAQGPHHCLGAPLARLEIRVLLEELMRLRIKFTANGEVVRTRSNFVNGIMKLPATISI